ncbi:MAG: hypothetical protein MJE77_45245 [Proteobacteria bacterium]|nr:hypothetical protein [Pseudomonadota bacterium]
MIELCKNSIWLSYLSVLLVCACQVLNSAESGKGWRIGVALDIMDRYEVENASEIFGTFSAEYTCTGQNKGSFDGNDILRLPGRDLSGVLAIRFHYASDMAGTGSVQVVAVSPADGRERILAITSKLEESGGWQNCISKDITLSDTVSGIWDLELRGDGSHRIDFDFVELLGTTGGPVCGNGQVEDGEECDDGNDIDNDTCRNDCTLNDCGSGTMAAMDQERKDCGGVDGGTGGGGGGPLHDLYPDAPSSYDVYVRRGNEITTTSGNRGRRRHEPSCIAGQLGAGPDTCDFDNYHFMYWVRNTRTIDWTISDYVAAGTSRIRIQIDMKSRHANGGPAHLRCFTEFGTVSSFYHNYAMQPVGNDASLWVHEITQFRDSTDQGAARPFRVGDIMQCEVTLQWQDLANQGFQANYYSRRIRYRVGIGGLVAHNSDPNVGPISDTADNLVAGYTTDTVRVTGERARSFMQFALNGQHDGLELFLRGRRVFRTSWTDGKHHDPTGTSDPLPEQPTFTELALGVTPQIAQSEARCSNCHVNDGNGPRFSGMQFGTPALIGLGLLEAISVADIEYNAAEQERDGDPLTNGQINVQTRNGIEYAGRFGWRADAINIRESVVRAMQNEMGIANPPAQQVDELATYVQLLAVPAPRSSNVFAMPGFARFNQFGCQRCHTKRWYTTGRHPRVELRRQRIRPLTDMLTHDLGDGTRFRTTPLWAFGLKHIVRGQHRYWHDGSAASVHEAIQRHGGEAANTRAAYNAAPSAHKQALIEFLLAL